MTSRRGGAAITTYNDLRSEISRLRAAGRTADALVLVEAQGPTLKGHVAYVHLWRMTLACALGRSERAVEAFAEALAADCRYPETLLRSWPGLDRLRGDVGFERLVRIAATRYEAEAAAARPRLLVARPEGTAPRAGHPLLVALHGNNSSEDETLPAWRSAAARGFVVAVPGSAEISLTPGRYLWNDGPRSRRDVVTLVDALARAEQIDRSALIVGGFSMGALRALELVYSRELAARGAIVVAPWLQPEPFGALKTMKPIPTVIIVGEDDRISGDGARSLQEHVAAAGVPAGLEIVPGLGHAYPEDMASRLGAVLDRVVRVVAGAA